MVDARAAAVVVVALALLVTGCGSGGLPSRSPGALIKAYERCEVAVPSSAL
ncbi:hypothetical protein [Pseudonocardia sp.]|uniref:hypothetical protein n=1 Tax=Pseudonocardia sp. TaxID=60912 RepID=UPI003D1508D4